MLNYLINLKNKFCFFKMYNLLIKQTKLNKLKFKKLILLFYYICYIFFDLIFINMKIGYFLGTFFPSPGGVQVQTHNIANTIVKKGNEIDFFLFNKTNVKNNRYGIIIINKLIISFFFYLNY